jgi:L-2-hydroxyglutarate oxidase LhgO
LSRRKDLIAIGAGAIGCSIANPLDDLRALHDVSFVMKDGVVFRHDR